MLMVKVVYSKYVNMFYHDLKLPFSTRKLYTQEQIQQILKYAQSMSICKIIELFLNRWNSRYAFGQNVKGSALIKISDSVQNMIPISRLKEVGWTVNKFKTSIFHRHFIL